MAFMKKCEFKIIGQCEDCKGKLYECNGCDEGKDSGFYECKCDCGNKAIICSYALEEGIMTDCPECENMTIH
jgi:hypothetical protein